MSFTSQQPGNGSQPVLFVSQLRQYALHMQHIDEMFSWMAAEMVQQWQIPLIQFWAAQAYRTGQMRLDLRTAVSQNVSLPVSVHANGQVAAVVKHLLRERQGAPSLPTAHIFSSPQAEMLAHYGLHYWVGYFLEDPIFLPPHKGSAVEKLATPLSMIISLFLHQPPPDRLSRAINFAFRQSFLVATNQGLLVTHADSIPAEPESIPQSVHPNLSLLIPRRSESIEEIKTGNPFASATILPDKQTRQFYSLVNGQRDIATLTDLAGLNQKEIEAALHFLLEHKKIQLYDSNGESVDISPILERS